MASLGRAAVMAVALATPAAGDVPTEVREFRLRATGSPEDVTTLARALAWRLVEAGIPGTADALAECGEVRVAVGSGVASETVRAALIRPFGRLEMRRVVELVAEADCAARLAEDRLCLAEPGDPPGPALALLTAPGFLIADVELRLGGNSNTGMPLLVVRLGPAEAERLCALTSESVGRQLAIVADGAAIAAPHVVEPICGGVFELSGTVGGEAGMKELQRDAARMAASRLPPPVVLRETLIDGQPAGNGRSSPLACADGWSPR